ncbi:MAG TPA: hypothetical protein VLI41_13735 [Phenylobacterium sp.]|uniref:hypothetical protein n=1 Tax=Phenylobacterium sp. TaxID=1871053 RepID=UPI002C76E514|nr:hypothetical protein [Phenylobacterium sp.]HSV04254.1 hypothetical protein [Phenylobacterium sp.]
MQLSHNLTGREISRHICSELARFGIVPAKPSEMRAARALASELIGGDLVTVETLQRVQAYTGCAIFVAHEDGIVSGVLAWVPFNAAGAAAMRRLRFNIFDPAPQHMASPAEVVCGNYGWGVAGATKATAKRLREGSAAMSPHFDHVPRYARAVTDAGRRYLCDLLGYRELPGSDGLVWLPPLSQRMPAEAA